MYFQKESKHSCIASSSTAEDIKCSGCSQPSCSSGACDGRTGSTSKPCACDHKECACVAQRLDPESCPSCTEKTTAGEMCNKCNTAKTLALENSKTKCKLEQLRLVMQQKKQRREARKLKTMPYTNTPPKTIPTDQATIQEEIETVA